MFDPLTDGGAGEGESKEEESDSGRPEGESLPKTFSNDMTQSMILIEEESLGKSSTI